jgi:plastocyanin
LENKESRPATLTVAFLLFLGILLPLLVAVFLVYNLQGPPPATAGNTGTANTTQGAVTITIPNGVGANQSLNFEPAIITVEVGVNNTINWVQEDPIPHTVTSTSVPNGASNFDSKTLNKGQSFSVTLAAPGTYQYDCTFHPGWMKGTIVVVGPGPALSSTASTGSQSGKTVSVTLPKGVGSNPNLNFDPAVITVVVGSNNTITWADKDPVPHTVTSTSVPTGAKAFDSGNMKEGDVFSVTLTVPGTYQYWCLYHSGWMKGTIVVKPAP